MSNATCKCMYNDKVWLVIELADEFNLRPEVLRGRFRTCKESVKHEGKTIPVVTDHQLRRCNQGLVSFHVNAMNKEWQSRRLV